MISTPTAAALLREWAGSKAIDHHCHPLRRWPFKLSAVELRSAFSEALDPTMAQDHVVSTAAYQGAIKRLAAELGCEPEEAAVLEKRNSAEPSAHARQMLSRTNTGAMLVDQGFASADSLTLAEQESSLGIRQREIVRLETLAESLVIRAGDAAEWFSMTREALRKARDGGAVGVKTICAYRASLRLEHPQQTKVDGAFRQLKAQASSGQLRLSGNALCHALLFEAALECVRLELALQVHCGFGDPDEDLAETSPLGLRPLFIEPEYKGLQVALLHCYPYHREAAYLCGVFPGAFMDLSLAIPFASVDGARALKEALGLCPISKLLYASDASRYPEVFFVAATLHREALADALAELVDRDVLTAANAVDAGSQILAGNAARLYRI